MKTEQWRHKGDQDENISNVQPTLYTRLYMYIDRPAMTTSAAERMVTHSYSKLMSHKMGHSDSSKFGQVQ